MTPSPPAVPAPPEPRPRAIGAAVAASLLLLLSLGLLGHRLMSPTDGATVEPGRAGWQQEGVVVAHAPAGGQLRAGDLVVAIDGRSLAASAAAFPAGPPWSGAATTRHYTLRRGSELRTVEVTVRQWAPAAALTGNWGGIALAVVVLGMGAFLVRRRPDEPAARALLLFGAGITLGVTALLVAPSPLDVAAGRWALIAANGLTVVAFAAQLHFGLVFPHPPRFVEQHPQVLVAVWLAPAVLHLGTVAASLPGSDGSLPTVWIVTSAHVLTEVLYAPALVAVLAWRAWRDPDPVVRRPLRWVVGYLAMAGVAYFALWVLPEAATGRAVAPPHLAAVLFLPFMLLVGATILRHDLFDLGPIVNRSLVYLGLTASVVAIYAIAVGGLAVLFQQAETSFTVTLVATAVVAVAFDPIRRRLQQGVDRLLYGDRRDPYGVVRRVAEHLDRPVNDLETTVQTVADALHLRWIAVEQEGQPAVATGSPGGPVERFPITHAGEALGALAIAVRPGDELSSRDRQLLDDLSRQLGVALRNARLADDLQRSREHLVAALEEERRRLRRDLHDGIGPMLAGIRMKTRAVRNVLASDRTTAEDVLGQIERDTARAVGEIRRVASGLRPPALDQLGLVGAVRQHAASLPGLDVAVDAAGDLRDLPAAVEVAAFHVALEAITNAARHAAADRCHVRLARAAGTVVVEITDDGVGIDADHVSGVGLLSMHERAAELGGSLDLRHATPRGTKVVATLPVPRTSMPPGQVSAPTPEPLVGQEHP